MANKKKIKKVVKLPKVQKELKDFIADEQGKMTRQDVAKLGVSLAVLGMMMQPKAADACCNFTNSTNPTHANSIQMQGNAAVHSNVTSEITTHCNHCSGGWMC